MKIIVMTLIFSCGTQLYTHPCGCEPAHLLLICPPFFWCAACVSEPAHLLLTCLCPVLVCHLCIWACTFTPHLSPVLRIVNATSTETSQRPVIDQLYCTNKLSRCTLPKHQDLISCSVQTSCPSSQYTMLFSRAYELLKPLIILPFQIQN